MVSTADFDSARFGSNPNVPSNFYKQWLTDLPELLKQFVYDGKDYEGTFIGTSDPDEEEGYKVSLSSHSCSDEHILISPAYWICGK